MTPASKHDNWASAVCATPDEIIELQRLGFKVEDLGAEYGPAHQGAFRWINIVAGEFQQDADSRSEAEAWAAAKEAAASKHERESLPGANHTANLTPAQLETHYSHGGANGGGQHPVFTRADWRHAVGDGETVTGYWAWLASEIGISQGKRDSAKQGQPQRLRGWLGAHH